MKNWIFQYKWLTLQKLKRLTMSQKINQYITQAYSSIRSKSKRRGDEMPNFSKEEFKEWLYNNGVLLKWIFYVESGYNKEAKPSVDRIDDYCGYTFDNMQLITWKENQLKGVNGEKHHKNSHNRNLYKSVVIYKGKDAKAFIQFDSVNECAEWLGVHKVSVSRVLNGTRKTIKGYKVALTGEELTIKE